MYLFKNVRRVSTGIVADVSRDFEALFLHVSLFHALGASHQEALLGMYLYVHTYIFFYIHCRLGQNGRRYLAQLDIHFFLQQLDHMVFEMILGIISLKKTTETFGPRTQ